MGNTWILGGISAAQVNLSPISFIFPHFLCFSFVVVVSRLFLFPCCDMMSFWLSTHVSLVISFIRSPVTLDNTPVILPRKWWMFTYTTVSLIFCFNSLGTLWGICSPPIWQQQMTHNIITYPSASKLRLFCRECTKFSTIYSFLSCNVTYTTNNVFHISISLMRVDDQRTVYETFPSITTFLYITQRENLKSSSPLFFPGPLLYHFYFPARPDSNPVICFVL